MPHCENCGGHISTEFMRVVAPSQFVDRDALPICPECPDIARSRYVDVLMQVVRGE